MPRALFTTRTFQNHHSRQQPQRPRHPRPRPSHPWYGCSRTAWPHCCPSSEGTAAASAPEPPAPAPAPAAAAAAADAPGPPLVPLVLSSGVFILPHPQKVLKGGEDGYFIAASQRAVGVADGVGGCAGVGIDAGAYARLLMKHARDAADTQASSVSSCSDRDECEALMMAGQDTDTFAKLCAQEILETAYNRTDVPGSSTACIAVLNGASLQITNLGDSGGLLVRSSQTEGLGLGLGVVMATQQQQHAFNFPFQVGGDRKGDQPHQAERYEVEVHPGDVVILATDGLWDNCFSREVVSVIMECRKAGLDAATSAKSLVLQAQRRSADMNYASPFALTARKAGIDFMGGKVDDITVLVAFVEPAAPSPSLSVSSAEL